MAAFSGSSIVDVRTLKTVRNNRVLLKEQFDSIPQCETQLAELPPNTRPRCRYSNVLPNPETRVPISMEAGVPASTFINANFVDGHSNCKSRYIATQGPLPNTIDDFWRMVWEHNVETIVMTTGLEEGQRKKCERYWPMEANTEETYKDIQVRTVDVTAKGAFVVTTMSASKAGEQRKVKHFWFTSWPDHGAPESPAAMIKFVYALWAETDTKSSPVVVHCSAGIGRTGTLIAIDHGMRDLLNEWRVTDVMGIVTKMRQQRGGSVQSIVQYEFIYKALSYFATMGAPESMFGLNRPHDISITTSSQQPHFGFTIRGSYPAFMLSVDGGGLAALQGAKAGDHILAINGTDASNCDHRTVVSMIRQSGPSITLTIISKSNQ